MMCLAIPGKVLEIEGDDLAFRSATVDFCGVRKMVNLAFTPEVKPGDYVLVHVGFAISRIDQEEAAARSIPRANRRSGPKRASLC